MAAKWSLRVGLAWLTLLVATSWFLGRTTSEDDSSSASTWLVLGLGFVITVALGVALVAERRGVLVVAAAFGGSFVAMMVVSTAVFSGSDDLDTFYPQYVFVEALFFLLVPLVIGAVLQFLWRTIRR